MVWGGDDNPVRARWFGVAMTIPGKVGACAVVTCAVPTATRATCEWCAPLAALQKCNGGYKSHCDSTAERDPYKVSIWPAEMPWTSGTDSQNQACALKVTFELTCGSAATSKATASASVIVSPGECGLPRQEPAVRTQSRRTCHLPVPDGFSIDQLLTSFLAPCLQLPSSPTLSATTKSCLPCRAPRQPHSARRSSSTTACPSGSCCRCAAQHLLVRYASERLASTERAIASGQGAKE